MVEEEAEAFIFGSGTGALLGFGEGSVPEVEGSPKRASGAETGRVRGRT